MLDEDLKTILKDKCDLTVLSTEVTIDQIKYWKLVDIVDTAKLFLEKPDILTSVTTNKLKLLLESNNGMWVEKFKVAIISNNIYDEVMIFIKPGEFDIYSVTSYEDILLVLQEEFLSNLVKKRQELINKNNEHFSNFSNHYFYQGDIYTTTTTNAITNVTYVNEL